MPERLVIAVPKGRVLKAIAESFASCGFDPDLFLAVDRRLVREDPANGVAVMLLKPDDVPTYVEYGAADLGVVGRDVLVERNYDLFAPVDLGIGRCRMVVAGPEVRVDKPHGRPLRVATKFARIASEHFRAQGQAVEIIDVQSSVEIAPLVGLADVIVDLVESGETLRQNGLVEYEDVMDISSVLIANRVGLKLKQSAIRPIISALAAQGQAR
ncbi:MAG: ATP phosphoribosyltransferase [Myxococcales bacterium]|nr:ATP phosphoribosyltransferase [Myxococcales bacterium]